MTTTMLACFANGEGLSSNLRAFHRFHRRSRSIFVLILILSTVVIRDSEQRGDGRVQGLHQDGYDGYQTNRIREDEKDEKLYIERSGDPWGLSSSISHDEKENVYARVSPANFTLNSTRGSSSGKESFIRARFKRGVVHLYNMVVCATGCNPLVYKGYGCYCGFLGSGYVIDGIDKCCKMHDWCYDATGCPMFMEYFVPYYWKCYHGYKPICAVEHGNWGASGSCAQRLCECDRSLAECLRRYPCPTTKAVCTSSPWRLVQNLFMVM